MQRYVRFAEAAGLSRRAPLPEKDELLRTLHALLPTLDKPQPGRNPFAPHREELLALITKPHLCAQALPELARIAEPTRREHSPFKPHARTLAQPGLFHSPTERNHMLPDAQLNSQLRRLKLSGVLNTLETRLLLAQQNQLDYKTFLSLVLEDELEARHARKIKRLAAHARFGCEQTLEQFDFALAPGLNATLIRELATMSFLARGEGVIFTGPPGTGKTHLAKALGHAACPRGYRVCFHKFHELCSGLAKAELAGTLEEELARLGKCDLLIIDDFAFRKIDHAQSEQLYTIVNHRYNTRSTILTSNRAFADWMGIFPDAVMAGAILDRLMHHAHQV